MNKIDAIKLMAIGHKMRHRDWSPGEFIYMDLKDGDILDHLGVFDNLNDYLYNGWEVYIPVKKKITKTVKVWVSEYNDTEKIFVSTNKIEHTEEGRKLFQEATVSYEAEE